MEQKQQRRRRQAKESKSDDDLYDEVEVSEKESMEESFDTVKSKRGRPKIPDQWSRVISISNDDLDDVKVYELGPDLLLSKAVTATLSRGRTAKEWKPLFWPEQYAKKHDMTVAGNTLTEEQLAQHGQKVTQARTLQRERAAALKNDGGAIDQEAYLRSAKALVAKMHLGYFREPKKENEYHQPQLNKKEKWYDLSLDNKIDIIHEVLILKRPQQDVAKKYYRTAGYVSRFVKRFR
jgi:hypothetical protein